ncbi:MAG: hypothetical protein AAF611_08860 [Bacteroidota bacterium]
MKKRLLFKKIRISKLNQLRVTGGGKTETTTDSGYDPSDNTTSYCSISCDPNDNIICDLIKSIDPVSCP